MASIRRTLSPAFQDRPYVNGGGSPFSVPSPSQKLLSSSRYSPPFPSSILAFSVSVRSFVAGVLFHRPNRKGQQWRRGFYRCLLFFFLGFLLGLLPFGHVDDDEIRGRSFNFDIKPPHVNVQLDTDNTDRAVKRMNVQFNTDNADRAEKRRNVQFDTDNADRAEKRRNVQFDTDNADRAEKRRNVQFDTDNADRTVKRREDLVDVRLGVVERRVDLVPRKLLIIVTPTYNRALQAYFLNRLGQLLGLVPRPLLWIVVETNAASMETAEILRKSGVMYRHLVCGNNSTRAKDRGVYQRNTALEHIERHRLDGIVYFADDDNIYSLDLFDRLRDISRFGTWPVAMLAQSKNKAILEGPVCNRSQVVGWHTNEKSKRLRRFHVDMSGFAFNSTILWDPKRWHRPTSAAIRQLDTVKEGFQETTFIEQVVEDESQMEGTSAGCSKVMNWHLHLEVHSLVYPKGWQLAKNLDVVLPIER